MRTVQTVGLIALAVSGCASGKSMPSEQADASETVDSSDPEMLVDARPDATPPDAPPDACIPVAIEKLVNPVFDLTPNGMGWVDGRDPATNLLPGGPFPIISANPAGVTPHSAPNKAWFGGANGGQVNPPKATLVDTLHQDIVIPASATNVVVTGYLLVGTNESGSTVYDEQHDGRGRVHAVHEEHHRERRRPDDPPADDGDQRRPLAYELLHRLAVAQGDALPRRAVAPARATRIADRASSVRSQARIADDTLARLASVAALTGDDESDRLRGWHVLGRRALVYRGDGVR
jgi:hypothetical protein